MVRAVGAFFRFGVLALLHDHATLCNMNRRTTFLTVRLPQQTHIEFRAKAQRYGGVSEVLRELVTAFIEDRLTIQAPKQQKESLYHVPRSQD